MYQFRVEVFQPHGHGSTNIQLIANPMQVRPLLGQLDSHPQHLKSSPQRHGWVALDR